MGRKLPDCRTQDTLLPGAYRLDEAQTALESMPGLSANGVERLLSIYGGRSVDIVELTRSEPLLARVIDTDETVLAAEVVFAIREEMARTLADIVHRRLMIGFAADQGRALYEIVAAIAAAELKWSDEERLAQLESLRRYSDSLRV
jgi:glycerol-3-phosphate dehydrogenase